MSNRISSVILTSLDRPDIGSISFALYTSGPYILERMDGWNAISDINTNVDPFQFRNGSNVSDPNQIGGKIVMFTVHINGDNESETIKTVRKINGILQGSMRLNVIDNGIESYLDQVNMIQGSYKLTREAPELYTLEFGVAAASAYTIRTQVFEQVLSAAGSVISGGIIYPTFTPYDDSVSYPDYVNAYDTVTQIYQQKIVIDGYGDIFPYFKIVGNFYRATITYTSSTGEKKTIKMKSLGAVDTNSYHEWWVNTETLEYGFTTPNTYGLPVFDDTPVIEQADWFILNVGENIISVTFDVTGATGTVTAKWQEKDL
jgi:hypothetical protein